MPLAAESVPLHVLTVTPFYPSLQDDANGCFIAEPLGTLAEMGVQNSVLAVQPFYRERQNPHPNAPPVDFVRYFSIPGGAGLASAGAFLFAGILSRVRELHHRRQIDIIHAHAPLQCGHGAMLLARELNIPFVVSVHGLDAYSTNQVQGLPGKWSRRITTRVFRSACRVICISERVREEVLRDAADIRTSVVYNGVSPDLFPPTTANPQSTPTILTIGNLIPIKGYDVLLRAVATVSASHPTLALQIVGDGPERPRLTTLARELNLSDRVRFLGRVSRSEVANLLRDCTLFALPSQYEGLGCVYLEAMSSARVAIGCRGQGIEEVIRHGFDGWLIDPGNVDQLVASLNTLLGNATLRESIGHQAHHTILNGLTLRHQAGVLLGVYQECRR